MAVKILPNNMPAPYGANGRIQYTPTMGATQPPMKVPKSLDYTPTNATGNMDPFNYEIKGQGDWADYVGMIPPPVPEEPLVEETPYSDIPVSTPESLGVLPRSAKPTNPLVQGASNVGSLIMADAIRQSVVGSPTAAAASSAGAESAAIPASYSVTEGSGAAPAALTGYDAATGGVAEAPAPVVPDAAGIGGGEIAAIIAAAIASGRGINAGLDTFRQGHGQQQQGVMELSNPMVTGAGRIAGVGRNQDMARLAALTTPLNMFLPGIGPAMVAADMAGVNFWGGKGAGQRERDQWRSQMQDLGLLDENYNMELANGAQFDMGKDTGARLPNAPDRRYLEVEKNNPVHQRLRGMADILATLVSKQDTENRDNLSNYFVNAATSNVGNNYESARNNMLAFFERLGIKTTDEIQAAMDSLSTGGQISRQTRDRLVDSAEELKPRTTNTFRPFRPKDPSEFKPPVPAAPGQRRTGIYRGTQGGYRPGES